MKMISRSQRFFVAASLILSLVLCVSDGATGSIRGSRGDNVKKSWDTTKEYLNNVERKLGITETSFENLDESASREFDSRIVEIMRQILHSMQTNVQHPTERKSSRVSDDATKNKSYNEDSAINRNSVKETWDTTKKYINNLEMRLDSDKDDDFFDDDALDSHEDDGLINDEDDDMDEGDSLEELDAKLDKFEEDNDEEELEKNDMGDYNWEDGSSWL